MLNWLHELPIFLGLVAVSAIFVIPTLLGSFFLQPYVARLFRGEKDINTVLGFLLNAFALYFGVLLALLSIAVFENHNKAQDAIDREAASLIRLVRDFRAYPEPTRTQLLAGLHDYIDEEIGPGWQTQRRGQVSLKEVEMMNSLHHTLATFEPVKQTDVLNHTQTLRTFSEFIESRRLRISQGDTNIPKIMWYVVLCGSVMNIVVIWMFDLSRSTHAIIAGTLSLFIGMVIYMVAVLDEPFRGSNGLKPDAIVTVHEQSELHK